LGGVFLHVTDPASFKPFLTGAAVVWAARKLYGERCSFPHGVYEYNSKHPAFDLLAGSAVLRGMIAAGADIMSIAASWISDEERFLETKKSLHLYD